MQSTSDAFARAVAGTLALEWVDEKHLLSRRQASDAYAQASAEHLR